MWRATAPSPVWRALTNSIQLRSTHWTITMHPNRIPMVEYTGHPTQPLVSHHTRTDTSRAPIGHLGREAETRERFFMVHDAPLSCYSLMLSCSRRHLHHLGQRRGERPPPLLHGTDAGIGSRGGPWYGAIRATPSLPTQTGPAPPREDATRTSGRESRGSAGSPRRRRAARRARAARAAARRGRLAGRRVGGGRAGGRRARARRGSS